MSIIRKSICKVFDDLTLVRKSKYGQFELKVDSLNFDSTSQGKVPFIGRSGEGKSTLLEALATMLMPSKGAISWSFYEDDKEIDSFNWNASRPLSLDKISLLRTRYFGFAFQDTTLTSYLTVLDNLIYPQKLLNPLQAKHRALEKLDEFFKGEDIAGRYPNQLSGGQRQRVALLQAMINDPFVLFADEPTGNLDLDTRKEVMSIIEIWQKKTGGMFLWVTHHESDLSENRDFIKVSGGKASMLLA